MDADKRKEKKIPITDPRPSAAESDQSPQQGQIAGTKSDIVAEYFVDV